MDPQRIEFIHRHEDKSSLMEARMWNGQSWFLGHMLAIKEDVQVDRARTGPVVIIPAERAFDFLEGRQETAWRNIRFKLHDSIEEPPFSWICPSPNRFRLIQQRDTFESRMWEETEQCHRPIAKIHPIADVRPESDEDSLHNHTVRGEGLGVRR
jgi:hypothetical protein